MTARRLAPGRYNERPERAPKPGPPPLSYTHASEGRHVPMCEDCGRLHWPTTAAPARHYAARHADLWEHSTRVEIVTRTADSGAAS